jgi:hypothetical protein
MIARYLIVLVGALVITTGLLFFMQKLVVHVSGGDNVLYFLVNDIIAAPDLGRQLPEAPPQPGLAPTRPVLSAPLDAQGAERSDTAASEDLSPELGLEPVPLVVGPQQSLDVPVPDSDQR